MTPALPIVAVETTPTQFTYSLALDIFGITELSITGIGSGFVYDPDPGDIEPEAGQLDALLFTAHVTTVTAGTPIPVSFQFWNWSGLDVDIAESRSDPDFASGFAGLLAEVPFVLPGYDLTTLATQIIVDATGTVLSAPNPMLVFASSGPAYQGTTGSDHITLLNVDRRVDVGAGDDFVSAQGDIGSVRVALRRGDDVFFGDDFDIFGYDGITTFVTGGVGDDTLIGGYGTDTLRGGQDDDLLLGLQGDDRLQGGSGDDFIFGGTGDDQIFAGAGRDVVKAGGGDNVVRGGVGSDVFWAESNISAAFDDEVGGTTTVLDFQLGIDKIFLSIIDLDVLRSQESVQHFFMGSSFQSGADTIWRDEETTLVLKNVQRDQITLDDFYDKSWLLLDETDVFASLF